MKIGQGLRSAALFSMLLVLITGCSQKNPQQLEKIVIGTQKITLVSPVWIAVDKGYFQEEGLNVEIREFPSGQAALTTMLVDKNIDLVTASQTPVVYNSFQRKDYAIIGGLVYSDKENKILVRQDRAIKSPEDLKGKTVGITRGTSSQFFLGLFLIKYRMRMSDIKMVDMDPPSLSEALVRGTIDAMVSWEPHIYLAKKILGDKAFIFPSQGLYRVDVYMVSRKDVLKDHPEVFKRFLRAIEKSEAFILGNRNEAIEIISKRLQTETEVVRAIWDDLIFRLSLDQSVLVSLEDHARWAIINKFTDVKLEPNYLDYINTEALKAVKPEAVSIAGR
jgi:ABC-type nitrate/sulfonate/bicarbonate transport system substrate-binding protein